MEYLSERITIDPRLCNGKPTIRGLRITVGTIMEFLTAGDTKEEILKHYPDLEPEDINACMRFATQLINRKYVIKEIAC